MLNSTSLIAAYCEGRGQYPSVDTFVISVFQISREIYVAAI